MFESGRGHGDVEGRLGTEVMTMNPWITQHDGPCTPGTSGEWVGRCTKCGQPC